MRTVALSQRQVSQIAHEGEMAYPNECCGALIGHDDASGRRVLRLEPLGNSFQADEQFHRFSLNPRDLMKAEKSAAGDGLLVLGFYHSHPDHPARPSEYDRVHAWPFYSYVIVAIAKGKAADMTSWQLIEATEQFEAEEILQIAETASPSPVR
jgi:proteasome lid subunit RPN8/RPN11